LAFSEELHVLTRHSHLFFTVAVICDAVASGLSWMLCYVLRFDLGLFPSTPLIRPGPIVFAKLIPLVLACNLFALGFVGLYSAAGTRSSFREWIPIVKASLLAWLGMLAALYYYSATPYSRVLLFIFLLLNPAALIAARSLARQILKILHARGLGTRSAAIVGAGQRAQELFHRLQANPWVGVRATYFVDEQERAEPLCGLPVRGSFSGLVECMREHPVETVFVAIPHRSAEKLDGVLDALAKLPLTVAVVPDFAGAITLSSSVAELEGLPIIQLRDNPIMGWHAVAKRAMDIAGSSILLALFGLPMLILALLVKLTSPGPVLFRQERMGLGGKPFLMLKFRTMRADAEQETGPVWAKKDDPRCTRLGALLRRGSLDELPQLLNVLRGEMSLVGPRPERPHFVMQFIEDLPAYMLRHNVKAGITGWAQVNGLRGNTSLRERLQYDLYYINHWSLGLDLLILLLTPFRGVASEHAY
jgi:exopolysaccharide biosynthesis polyprenyl glycosylphosphotransferase